mmetsp:Transcript_22550/g.22740  ORF Transcript_22550/g.22740 Transcript_22550/m.22740 type:complete len:367 (+) Transcript_22550:105-1205(+)
MCMLTNRFVEHHFTTVEQPSSHKKREPLNYKARFLAHIIVRNMRNLILMNIGPILLVISLVLGLALCSRVCDITMPHIKMTKNVMCFYGGFFSGGLHSLSGLDHLAAILPLSLGRPWWRGLTVGGLWGFGHGVAVCLLGTFCFVIKQSFISPDFFSRISFMSDYMFGLTLTVIGIMGVYEAKVDEAECEEDDKKKSEDFCSSSLLTWTAVWAIFVNGHIMGLSWDSLPSLAPALASSSYSQSILFLFGYLVSTLLSMAIAAAVLGQCSMWLGTMVNTSNLHTLPHVASSIALFIGIFCIVDMKLTSYETSAIIAFVMVYALSFLISRSVSTRESYLRPYSTKCRSTKSGKYLCTTSTKSRANVEIV